MKRAFFSFFIISFFLTTTSFCYGQDIEGTIKSKDGKLLSGVKVQPSGYIISTKTDENGFFKLDKATFKYLSDKEKNVIFFSKSGFVPKLEIAEKNKPILNIILEEDINVEKFEIKSCSNTETKDFYKAGQFLQILVPKKLKLKKNSNFEYISFRITLKKDGEEFRLSSWRGIYGDEFPPDHFILNSKSYEFRMTNFGIDWRGITNEGEYWRYLAPGFSFFETYQYTTKSKEASEIFDKALETICFQPAK